MKSDYIKLSVYNRIFQYMQYENALCLRLCLETGLRVGDALKVKAEDIDGRTISYIAEKTGKAGKKVITQKLAKDLKRLSGGGGYCFKGRFGGDTHRTRQAVWNDVKKASKLAGVPANVSPHSTRKTYAVGLFHEKGIAETEKELQHDRIDTTLLYAFSDLLSGESKFDEKNNNDSKILFDTVYSACIKALKDFFNKSDFTNSSL